MFSICNDFVGLVTGWKMDERLDFEENKNCKLFFWGKILKIKSQLDNYRVGRQFFPFAMMLSVR